MFDQTTKHHQEKCFCQSRLFFLTTAPYTRPPCTRPPIGPLRGILPRFQFFAFSPSVFSAASASAFHIRLLLLRSPPPCSSIPMRPHRAPAPPPPCAPTAAPLHPRALAEGGSLQRPPVTRKVFLSDRFHRTAGHRFRLTGSVGPVTGKNRLNSNLNSKPAVIPVSNG